MKIKKKFSYDGIEFRVVERDEPYMNSTEPVLMTRVLAPNDKVLPVQIQHRDTLKKIVERSILALDNFKSLGADIQKECTL